MHERLSWYQRFSGGRKPGDIDHLLIDFEAYYGTIPDEVRHLAGLMQTQMYCQKLGIERCAWLKVRVVFVLHPTSRVDGAIIDRLAKVMPKRMKREGATRFGIRLPRRIGATLPVFTMDIGAIGAGSLLMALQVCSIDSVSVASGCQ